MTYPVGTQGRKQTVSERGWFAPPFTGCRFAVIAQIALRMGYELPLARQPEGVENAVRDLQLAGDNTPGNGSTMAQGQKAIRALLPGSDFLFGTLTDEEFHEAVAKGATVGFAVNFAKMPRYLKNFTGYGYNGGHYMAVDGSDGDSVDLSDPMYRPAREAKPRRVPFADFKNAILRNGAGEMLVTMGYENVAVLRKKQRQIAAQIADVDSQIIRLEAQSLDLQAQQADVEGRLAGKVAA